MTSLFRQDFARLFQTRSLTSYRSGRLLVDPSQCTILRNTEKDVVFLDASWFMPNSPRNGQTEYHKERIPGARFLDLDEVASPHPLGLKHMMPDPQAFAKACGKNIQRCSFEGYLYPHSPRTIWHHPLHSCCDLRHTWRLFFSESVIHVPCIWA